MYGKRIYMTCFTGFLSMALVAKPMMGQDFPQSLKASSLSEWGKVGQSDSDQRSNSFNKEVFPVIQQLVSKLLVSGKEFGDRDQYRLDQDKLFTTSFTPYPARVYFIAEGAGYKNSVGLSLNLAGSVSAGDMRLIFSNASMPVQDVDFTNGKFGKRRSDAPLLPGDFVDIGLISSGVQLDFFIIQDGASGGSRYVFTNHDSKNADKTQHVISFVIPDSPYILVGFEDLLNGGDKDYEDVLLVLDIGVDNVRTLTDASRLPN